MIEYIIKDLALSLCYLPDGLIVGAVFALLLKLFSLIRRKKKAIRILPLTAFVMYSVIILCMTFLSRESGSRIGIDLELFSTWGINARNNAYVVENILLFIPYGIVVAWAFPALRNLVTCAMTGLLTSLIIEWLQFLTQRGYFQIDDILTNFLGGIIGYLIFRMFWRKDKHHAVK